MMDHAVILLSPAASGNVAAAPTPSPGSGATPDPATATSTAGATSAATSPAQGTTTGGTATATSTATPTSTPTPAGGSGGSASYAGELFFALGIMAVVLAGAWALWWGARKTKRTRYGGLITGIDNRYSTSKVIAVAWTVLVAWMVVSVSLIAALPAHPPGTFSELLAPASDLYFVLLGGPFAAAAFAKASVQSKLTQGTLTKTPSASGPSGSDFISDDYGNTDLSDFQYVLFNILALLIVIIAFWLHPQKGLPEVPQFLAILTGGAALVYTVNKAIATGGAQITQVDPEEARIDDVITITGGQLISKTAGAALPTVTIGGINATNVQATSTGDTDTLTATVADAPSGTSLTLTGSVDVVVSPPQASPVTSRNAIKIVADQPALNPPAKTITKAGPLTVTGKLLLAPGTLPGTASSGTASVGGLTPELTVSGSSWPVTLEGPYSRDMLTLQVGNPPASLGAGVTGEATLTVTRGALSATAQVKYKLP